MPKGIGYPKKGKASKKNRKQRKLEKHVVLPMAKKHPVSPENMADKMLEQMTGGRRV